MSERDDPYEEPEYVFRSQKQLQFHKFEKLGEEGVRRQLAQGRYQGQNLEWVREWLSRFDEATESSRQAESDELARRSTEASELASREACEANRIAWASNALAEAANSLASRASRQALIANITSAMALIASIISLIVSIVKPS